MGFALGGSNPSLDAYFKRKRNFGLEKSVCRRCGYRGRGVINQYNLHYCKRCFREIAEIIGFKKYS
ncbi:MAG: 30S ribosomal protein S14 [Candidatus Aenigmarchaeota archaeon ex4484_52]|nr:MAG: 30S ribosomal protein S14 [Candidatus Aenigmarchaeota archaeon ex4484_52]